MYLLGLDLRIWLAGALVLEMVALSLVLGRPGRWLEPFLGAILPITCVLEYFVDTLLLRAQLIAQGRDLSVFLSASSVVETLFFLRFFSVLTLGAYGFKLFLRGGVETRKGLLLFFVGMAVLQSAVIWIMG